MERTEFDLNWHRVSYALSALIRRTNSDSFVIFEERCTKKFVQFAFDADRGLYLDLPVYTRVDDKTEPILTEEETFRASTYFRNHGIEGPTTDPTYKGPEGLPPAGYYTSFNIRLEENVILATVIVLDVFHQIYQFPNGFELLIKEN